MSNAGSLRRLMVLSIEAIKTSAGSLMLVGKRRPLPLTAEGLTPSAVSGLKPGPGIEPSQNPLINRFRR